MRKKVLFLELIVMMAILTACGFGEKKKPSETDENRLPIEYTYEKDTIRYGEMSGTFSFVKEVEKTQTDCAAYYFETVINREEREACIAATDKVLSCIEGMLPEIEIVVFKPESYEGVAVYGNRLYIPMQPWDSVEYVAGVLLAGYGEWGNYGLVYGYANYLCKEMGWNYRETAGFQKMSSQEPYDLNLLCFNEHFVLPEDVEAAKNNACCFVNEYLSAHPEEEFLKLLSDSGTAEGVGSTNEVLEAFYKENGVECSLTEIRYQYGGVSHDYAAACEYACFYIEKNWQDICWADNPMVSEDFLHKDYGEVREFLECNAQQMAQYQELFAFDNYDNDISVAFTNGKSALKTSFYVPGAHIIYLESVVSLMHEYIHFLMEGRYDGEEKWKIEGFARYFSYKYDLYSYDFLNNDWNNTSREWIQEYIVFVDRPIDVKTDFRKVEDIEVYACGHTDPNFTYLSGSSFIGYLADQYGEQAVIAYVCSDDTYNAEWDKSYKELVQDWIDYIEANYAHYSKIQ